MRLIREFVNCYVTFRRNRSIAIFSMYRLNKMAFGQLFTDFVAKCKLLAVILLLLAISPCSCVHMYGFRVESLEPEYQTTDSVGRVYVVGGRYMTLRLFTNMPQSTTSEISFASVSAAPDSDCDDLRSTGIFPMQSIVGSSISAIYSSTVVVYLASDPAVYMFCVRTAPGMTWQHQGNSSWLQIAVTEPIADPDEV